MYFALICETFGRNEIWAFCQFSLDLFYVIFLAARRSRVPKLNSCVFSFAMNCRGCCGFLLSRYFHNFLNTDMISGHSLNYTQCRHSREMNVHITIEIKSWTHFDVFILSFENFPCFHSVFKPVIIEAYIKLVSDLSVCRKPAINLLALVVMTDWMPSSIVIATIVVIKSVFFVTLVYLHYAIIFGCRSNLCCVWLEFFLYLFQSCNA